VYQYIDTERKNRSRSDNSVIGKYFPERLWEENIQILEKALDANNEALYPENEGNINLNMANNYFLLLNYPRALRHYREAARYKQRFNSEIEKALFHFHYGYCYWQNGETAPARAEIQKAYNIYSTLAASAPAKEFANQYLILYRYFALLSRYDGKYDEAIDWYQRILSFADTNSLSVDRARYLQEIAHCYMEKGELETAVIFINRAGAMLKNYPDDERKYYLNIRLFGIGPIPVFNMGPDNAVIGNNRIFHPLDRNDKRLLNIAMLEDISLKNNDYSAAIEYQKAKLKLLEKSKTSLAVETKIRSLNNIGYYYYEMGRFNDAEKYFNQSRSTASANNNLEGLFTSIMNLTNLYALLIENNLSPERNWIKDTESLAASLDNYRNSYYDLRLKQERDALEEAA
ncbi:MAG: tetratricopeptide repeat protein, partial [Clostridia bacterium]|nr:tetratricopeptide repeat protein [Clostridia bacterium]